MANQNVKPARNPAIDFLKGLACIGVVFNHVMFPGLFGVIVAFTSYFAVPIFFMITGFYAYQANDRTITRRLIKIFRITLFAMMIYSLYTLQHTIRYNKFSGGFTVWDIAETALRFVFLSDCHFISANHLWYLVSLIEGYIILLLIRRYNLFKAAYIYIPFSIIAHRIMSTFFTPLWHLRANVFLNGMCWILTGHYIAENLQAVSRINKKVLIASAIAGYISWIIVSLTCHKAFVFIANVVCFALAIVPVFILPVRKGAQSVKYPSLIVKIGAEYSLYIYLYHMLMDYILSSFLYRLGIPSGTGIILWTRPVIVLLMSIALSFVIVKARERMSRKNEG